MTVDYPADIEAVVYDLDGTLLRLDVDWDAVYSEVVDVYREAGHIIAEDTDVWDLLERADQHGLASEVEAVIAEHEREGARTSTKLALADDLDTVAVPIGVCSLNCEAACRLGLETHELHHHVQAIVGRDSVERRKPDPEPLLAVIEALGVSPGETLFVGDSASDETTADRAGTRFAYVGSGPTNLGL